MSSNPSLNSNKFKLTYATCLVLCIVILVSSAWIGKIRFFLLLNNDLGPAADYFFKFITYGGDGILWAGWLIYMFVNRSTRYLPLIVTSFLSLTFITQLCKQVILPNEPRPSFAILDQHLIHYVKGVTIHSINSFPSGHTATAFLFVLLISLLSKLNWLIIAGITTALLVGYSRVYLAQHFPVDVGGGILTALISIVPAIVVQNAYFKKNKKNNPLEKK